MFIRYELTKTLVPFGAIEGKAATDNDITKGSHSRRLDPEVLEYDIQTFVYHRRLPPS